MDYFCLLLILQIMIESFPVSSSGHVALAICLLNYGGWNTSLYNLMYTESVDHLLHGPTLGIMMIFFRKEWWSIISQKRIARLIIPQVMIILLCADGITLIWYAIFSQTGKTFFPLWLGFLITACLLYSLRFVRSGGYCPHNVTKGCLLGLVQSIALLPGISRFGSTYVAARWLNVRPKRAFELSMLIQSPLIIASFLKSLHSLYIPSIIQQGSLLMVCVIGGATFVAYGCLYLTGLCIEKKYVWLFSIYMILPITIALLLC